MSTSTSASGPAGSGGSGSQHSSSSLSGGTPASNSVPSVVYSSRAADVTNIIQTVNGVSAASDAHDWKWCRTLMVDDVEVDYSALTGQPNARVNADVLLDGWSKFLPGFKKTQHLLGSHVVELNADATAATCVTALQLTFLLPNDGGSPIYQVWGGFEHTLRPTHAPVGSGSAHHTPAASPLQTPKSTPAADATAAGGAGGAAGGAAAGGGAAVGPRRWRVDTIKLLVHHAAGNPNILALAGRNIAAQAQAQAQAQVQAQAAVGAGAAKK